MTPRDALDTLERAKATRRRAFDELLAAEDTRSVDAATLAGAEGAWTLAALEEVKAECLLDQVGRHEFLPVGPPYAGTQPAVDAASAVLAVEMLEGAEELAEAALRILRGEKPTLPSRDELDELFRERLERLGRVNRSGAVSIVMVRAA